MNILSIDLASRRYRDTSVRGGPSLLILDLERGTRSPLMATGANFTGVWTHDGLRFIYASNRGGDWDIYTQPTDGSRPADVLLQRPYNQFPASISADGTLIFREQHPDTGMDLWILSPDGQTVPLRVTRYNGMDGQFSPDGRWVVYTSNESGQDEIYMQSYPAGANRTPVSSRGGSKPRWSRDGRELFYIEGNALVAVPVRVDGAIGALTGYDVTPDGQRFLMTRPDPGSVPRQLNVILNWASDSAQSVPATSR